MSLWYFICLKASLILCIYWFYTTIRLWSWIFYWTMVSSFHCIVWTKVLLSALLLLGMMITVLTLSLRIVAADDVSLKKTVFSILYQWRSTWLSFWLLIRFFFHALNITIVIFFLGLSFFSFSINFLWIYQITFPWTMLLFTCVINNLILRWRSKLSFNSRSCIIFACAHLLDTKSWQGFSRILTKLFSY